MCKRVCINLRDVLEFDEGVNIFLAFEEGSDETKVRLSWCEEISVMCRSESDVVFVINCEEADICFAKPLERIYENLYDISQILDEWGVEYSVRPNSSLSYGEFQLYEKGFKAVFSNREYAGGITDAK